VKTVDELTEQECRELLKAVQLDVIAGQRAESSADIGEFVTATLTKAGLQTKYDPDVSDLGEYMDYEMPDWSADFSKCK
jgi:hypothetical protein